MPFSGLFFREERKKKVLRPSLSTFPRSAASARSERSFPQFSRLRRPANRSSPRAGLRASTQGMKRHHEVAGDVAQEVGGFAEAAADDAIMPATKRPRSSPAAAAAAPAATGGPITVWQPSPFALAAKDSTSSGANGEGGGEEDPMEADENEGRSSCPLLGRRRLATAKEFLSPPPFFATPPLARLPLPLPPTPPVPQQNESRSSSSSNSSMAIVLYQPSAADAAARRRRPHDVAGDAHARRRRQLASSSSASAVSGPSIEAEKERRRRKRAAAESNGGFERIEEEEEEEEEEEGEPEAMTN